MVCNCDIAWVLSFALGVVFIELGNDLSWSHDLTIHNQAEWGVWRLPHVPRSFMRESGVIFGAISLNRFRRTRFMICAESWGVIVGHVPSTCESLAWRIGPGSGELGQSELGLLLSGPKLFYPVHSPPSTRLWGGVVLICLHRWVSSILQANSFTTIIYSLWNSGIELKIPIFAPPS
jgi:hypothetical protein